MKQQSKEYLNSLYESLGNTEPTTITGQHYKATVLQGDRSYSHIMATLNESLEDSHDDALNAWANEQASAMDVNDQILIRFQMAMDGLVNPETGSYTSDLNRNAHSNLSHLLDLGATDLISAIDHGVLNEYGWIPAFTELNKMVTAGAEGLRAAENINESFVTYSPFSMIGQKNGMAVVRIKGKNYGVDGRGKLFESEGGVETPGYNQTNDAIEALPYDDKEDQWKAESSVGLITISPYEKCIRLNGEAKTCEALREELTKIIKDGEVELNESDVKTLDHALAIGDNFEDIAILDEVKIFENLVTRENIIVLPNDDATEIAAIENGDVKYANNLETLLEYCAEKYHANVQPLLEQWSPKIKKGKLLESVKEGERKMLNENKAFYQKALLEVDQELALVDAGSEAAVILEEAREKIKKGLDECDSKK